MAFFRSMANQCSVYTYNCIAYLPIGTLYPMPSFLYSVGDKPHWLSPPSSRLGDGRCHHCNRWLDVENVCVLTETVRDT